MKRGRVEVLKSTPKSRLYPRYDEEAGILAIESRVQRGWPFGFTIGGDIVFDIDKDRILANVDLHIR